MTIYCVDITPMLKDIKSIYIKWTLIFTKLSWVKKCALYAKFYATQNIPSN